MEYRILGKTGLQVSAIGFGGIPIQRISDGDAAEVINRALDRGINFFDSARGYADSESKMGTVLGKRRKEAIIATKSMARTRDEMEADIKRSLEHFGVGFIDLYQLHNVKEKDVLQKVMSPGGALTALKEAQKEGVIGHIGITGHIRSTLVEALRTGEMETVQFPFNAVEQDGAGEMFKVAREHNVGVIIMKPLAGGALRDAGAALRYILEHPVSTVIPGMDSAEQVEENARAGEDPFLRPEEKDRLEKEARTLGTTFCRRCEYCLPCPRGVDIPTVFLFDGYYTRYELKDWARERYRDLPVKADACEECGECEEKCPYNLPIRSMLAEARQRLCK